MPSSTASTTSFFSRFSGKDGGKLYKCTVQLLDDTDTVNIEFKVANLCSSTYESNAYPCRKMKPARRYSIASASMCRSLCRRRTTSVCATWTSTSIESVSFTECFKHSPLTVLDRSIKAGVEAGARRNADRVLSPRALLSQGPERSQGRAHTVCIDGTRTIEQEIMLQIPAVPSATSRHAPRSPLLSTNRCRIPWCLCAAM